MNDFITSDMAEDYDIYWEVYMRNEEKREEEEQEIEKLQEKFIESNLEMFEYLTDDFGPENALAKMQRIIVRLVEKYPIISSKELSKLLQGPFKYVDRKRITTELFEYMSKRIRVWTMANKNSSKDWSTIDYFTDIYSYDLAEFLTCVIYNSLKYHEYLPRNKRVKLGQINFEESFDFYPISQNKFALGKTFWFKGQVIEMYKTNSRKGYPYAHITIADKNSKEYMAVVRTKNFFKLLKGLAIMRDNDCDIAILGKLIYDNYKKTIVVEADRFTLKIKDTYIDFPQ